MGRFIGFTNYSENQNYLKEKNCILNMNLGAKEKKHYINDNVVLNCLENEKPFIEQFSFAEYSIIFNGNIYNKKELQELLIQHDVKLEKPSSSELVLNLYINFDTEIFEKLNGAFSFVIWDGKEKQVVLVRDHFGIKPIFYTQVNNTLVFATEIKTLIQYPSIEKILDSSRYFGAFCNRTCTYSWNNIF